MFDLKNRASPNTKDAIVQHDILHVILQTVSVVVTGIKFSWLFQYVMVESWIFFHMKAKYCNHSTRLQYAAHEIKQHNKTTTTNLFQALRLAFTLMMEQTKIIWGTHINSKNDPKVLHSETASTYNTSKSS